MSKLTDIMTSPWAITPAMLCEIATIYNTHTRGDKIDLKEVEASIGRPLNNEHPEVEVINGVAVITPVGVIGKRMNLFTAISGGISTEMLGRDIEAALEDEQVHALVLDIDSPGGTVDGTFELADLVYNARGDKPIIALANGCMCSAAYAIGAAADAIYMTGPTTHVGSIGVVATHVDVSTAEQQVGVKTTEITAGKYKRIYSQYEPLSQEGREVMQEAVDFLYSVFVDRVAQFRGVPVSTVLDDMADGRIFIGQQAIDAGLVDGVSTLDDLVASLAEGTLPEKAQRQGGAGAASDDTTQTTSEEETTMSDKTYKASDITAGLVLEVAPEAAAQLRDEGAADAREAGATTERERIQGVLAHSMPGHEKLIEGLAFDGKTAPDAAAAAVLRAEQEARATNGSNLETDADELGKIKPSVDNGDDDDLAAASDEEKLRAKWDQDEDLQSEFGGRFESFMAFEQNKHRARMRGTRR